MNRTDRPREFLAHRVSESSHRLADGPVWDSQRGRVLWVDIDAGVVFEGRFADDRLTTFQSHRFSSTVGAVVAAPNGDLLVAAGNRLFVVRDDGRRAALGPVLIPTGEARRLNDGGCDPAGRFLIGSLATDDALPAGREQLWRLEYDGSMTVMDDDLTLSNGLAWSVDGGLFYSIDTTPGIVWVRSYDPATGRAGDREVLLQIDGSPDGMCVDVDGNLWIAVWGAGQVRCYSPAGEQLAVVTVAAPNTTSVAFIGPDLDRLLITSAAGVAPDAGALFVADVGVRGLPVTPWRPD